MVIASDEGRNLTIEPGFAAKHEIASSRAPRNDGERFSSQWRTVLYVIASEARRSRRWLGEERLPRRFAPRNDGISDDVDGYHFIVLGEQYSVREADIAGSGDAYFQDLRLQTNINIKAVVFK